MSEIEDFIVGGLPQNISPAEKERIVTVIAEAMERGRDTVARFLRLPPSLKINVLAAQLYSAGPGGEMGSLFFDELPEINYDHPGAPDRHTYRNMAWTTLVLFGFGDAQLLDPKRWEWKRFRDLVGNDDEPVWVAAKRYVLAGWECVGPGLRRQRLGVTEVDDE